MQGLSPIQMVFLHAEFLANQRGLFAVATRSGRLEAARVRLHANGIEVYPQRRSGCVLIPYEDVRLIERRAPRLPRVIALASLVTWSTVGLGFWLADAYASEMFVLAGMLIGFLLGPVAAWATQDLSAFHRWIPLAMGDSSPGRT